MRLLKTCGLKLEAGRFGDANQRVGLVLGSYRHRQAIRQRPFAVGRTEAEKVAESKALAQRFGTRLRRVDARLCCHGLLALELQLADVAGVIEALRQLGGGVRALSDGRAHVRDLLCRDGPIPRRLHLDGQTDHSLRYFDAVTLVLLAGPSHANRQEQHVDEGQRYPHGLVVPGAGAQIHPGKGHAGVRYFHGVDHLGAGETQPGIGLAHARTAQQCDGDGAIPVDGRGEAFAKVDWRLVGGHFRQGRCAPRFQQAIDLSVIRAWGQGSAAPQKGSESHSQRAAAKQRIHGGLRNSAARQPRHPPVRRQAGAFSGLGARSGDRCDRWSEAGGARRTGHSGHVEGRHRRPDGHQRHHRRDGGQHDGAVVDAGASAAAVLAAVGGVTGVMVRRFRWG